VPTATGPGTTVAADVQLFTETGECPGEVLVLAQGGYPSWLEFCSSNDKIDVNLAAARRWLSHPRDHEVGAQRSRIRTSPRFDRHHEFKFSEPLSSWVFAGQQGVDGSDDGADVVGRAACSPQDPP
jgi:hypothetical protein